MRRRPSRLLLLLTLTLVVGLPGCKKKAVATTPPPVAPAPRATPPARPADPPTTMVQEDFKQEPPIQAENIDDQIRTWNEQQALRTVYFGYDSNELTAEARDTLRANSDWLKSHRDVKVVVEGHCDERGSIEYNLALGERRAHSVRDHLVTLGVERPRIRIVTYGEERPADEGHAEAAWSRNRRAQFLLER